MSHVRPQFPNIHCWPENPYFLSSYLVLHFSKCSKLWQTKACTDYFPAPKNPCHSLFSSTLFEVLKWRKLCQTKDCTDDFLPHETLVILYLVLHFLNRDTQLFVSGNICSEGLKSPEIFGFSCTESYRFFFAETWPRTFVTRGLISSYCFRRDKYVV